MSSTITMIKQDAPSTSTSTATLRLHSQAPPAHKNSNLEAQPMDIAALGGVKPPTFASKEEERQYRKERLALAFRLFAKCGYDEGVAGHITVRDPIDPDCFWVNPFGMHFGMICASDLILVNHAGKVIDGGPLRALNQAAFAIHSQIHAARPDVIAAAHSHSLYGKAFAALGRPLDIITQDSCAFYNDHVLFDSFGGVVLADEEGRAIAKALGNKKAAILQNHGLLTVGASVESATFWFIAMDRCCHAQLLADTAAAGRGHSTIKIGNAEAAFTYRTVGSESAGLFKAKPMFDMMDRETKGEYKA